ncbi:hypothetical protein NIES970_22000 [[Synechococcus] sp. NIES-970]|nr:hypothetical protein NIES970_22000 [[Synechococcus] sp. NIES-970]
MMQVLIDSNLVLERFLNRDNDIFKQSQKLFQFIKKNRRY